MLTQVPQAGNLFGRQMDPAEATLNGSNYSESYDPILTPARLHASGNQQ